MSAVWVPEFHESHIPTGGLPMLHRETHELPSPTILAIGEIMPGVLHDPIATRMVSRAIEANPDVDPVREAELLAQSCLDQRIHPRYWPALFYRWMLDQAGVSVALKAGEQS